MSKKILDLLKRLHKEGIKIELDQGSLSIKSKQDSIESIYLEEIKTYKQDIISYLEKHQSSTEKNSNLLKKSITPFDRKSINKFPLSFSQERLWFIDQLEGSVAYHIPVVLRLQGDLSVSNLQSSLKEILSRHEVLRTIIKTEEGEGSQELLFPDDWSMDVIKAMPSFDMDNVLKNFIDQPFDLSKDYMMRACLYQLTTDDYLLAVVFHHISSDGWSDIILINEFVELYAAKKEKRSPSLNELSLQYIDYALWQREYIKDEVLDEELSYWKNQLTGISPLLLPTDYQRPLIKSNSGSGFSYELDVQLSNAISKLCKEQQVTSFMVLLSAFKIILARYSHQQDICVGIPIANRTQAELEELIGCFINSLALRSTIDNELLFIDLLQEVKKTTLEAYDHQLIPFEKVVDHVVDSRDMSTSPLFQVMFVLQNTHSETEIKLDGLTLSPYEQKNTTAKFDLTFTIEETASGFSLWVEYCTDLFKKETIQRMVVHYEELLKNIAQNPEIKVSNLSMITETEKKEQLSSLTTTSINYPLDQTVVSLFENQAQQNPDAIAVVYEDDKLTYKELNERSNQLANYLIAIGLEREELVPICVERSLDMIVGMIGVMKAGGVYVPLDSSMPKDRIDFILEDTQAQVMLTQSSLFSFFKENNSIKRIFLDQLAYKEYSISETKIKILPEHLIYVIYTSGTTGVPKGVLLEHRNVVRLFFNDNTLFDFNKQDVWSMFHSFSFDFSVWEMYGALLYGGKLVIVPKSHTLDTALFSKFIEKEGITVLNQTPSAFKVLQEEALTKNMKSSIRYLIFGGEALNPSILEEWNVVYPDCKIINMYGITETTVHVTYKEITEKEIEKNVSNIGTSLPTLGCLVLDENQQIVPIGVAGELYVLGAGVARGYLNRPELTKERFRKLSLEGLNETPSYRSGDLVRMLDTGELEYLGRIDTQVKIRGYRIELGEIEVQLEKLTSIKQSVVLAKEDKNGNKRLVAYIVSEQKINREEIIEELGNKLPEYMVPQLYVPLESFPLTSNGKINRKSFPEPPENAFIRDEYIASENEEQEILVEIWKNHLNLNTVGITDDYFRIGGDSITMIRLISEVNKKFEAAIKIASFYANPTIKGLSKLIYIESSEEKEKLILEIDNYLEQLHQDVRNAHPDSDCIEAVYPMSDIQKGMLITSQKGIESGDFGIYHDQFVDQIPLVDIELLQKSLHLLVAKHETLRTGFDFYDFEEPIQIIYIQVDNTIGYDDISKKETSEKEKYIKDFLLKERKFNPFQINSAPLWRINIFKVNDTEMIFVIQFHHAILDGWSEKSLKVELFNTYEILKQKPLYIPIPLRCKMRDSILSDSVEQQHTENKEYWKKELEGFKRLNIFTEESKIEMITKDYDDDFKDKLLEQCKNDGIYPKALFFSAYIYVLSMLSGEKDVTVGIVTNRRPMVDDGDKLLGCFLNTIPFRFEISSDIENWREYIQLVDQKIKELKGKDRLSLLEISKQTGHIHYNNPYFDVLFNFVDFHVFNQIENKTLLTQELKEKINIEDDFERTNTFLDLNVSLTFNRLQVGITQSRTLKSGHSIEDFYRYFDEFLNNYLNAGHKELDSTSLLQESEKIELIEVFNKTKTSYPKTKTIVDLFVDQVSKTPNHIAIVFEGKEITYKNLDELSNQLAHYLLSNYEIKIEDLIGVKLDRSEWLVISMLAILKTGCAYIPIDPSYPQERISYIIQDSKSKIVIDEVFLQKYKQSAKVEKIVLPKANIHSDNLAYVIYTSGSTGKPKGVLVEHSSLVNLCIWHQETYSVTEQSRGALFSGVGFDASVWEIYPYLLKGGTLYPINKKEERYDIFWLIDFITAHKVSHIYLPSQVCQDIVDEEVVLNGITILTGGDTLKLTKATSLQIYNNYGPTENTVVTSFYKLPENYINTIPIGKPISNTSIYILGSANELLPLGVVGELCVSGAGVARGYLNKENLTNEKFISNPFVKGERIYKTGDLAKWLPDGNIEFIGRKDDQVKIRGYRIELGEIENLLQEIPEVFQSIVLAKKDIYGNRRLIGYLVTEKALDKKSIQDCLQSKLPDYMIPKLWVELESLPITSNGKIDKKSLPDFDESELSAQNYVAPQNKIEENLCKIWQDLLGIERVGIYDNFFELGGHSLLATRLISILRKSMELEVKIKDIFEYTTVSELGNYISKKSNGRLLPQIVKQKPNKDIPLSYSQERLWFLDQLQGSVEYHIPILLKIQGDVDVQDMESTLKEIITRHEILRTVIKSDEGVGYQKVIPAEDWKMDIIKTASLESLENSVTSFIEQPFDLSNDYMFRACLLKQEEGEYILAVVIHHISSDGWSYNILVKELVELYASKKENRNSRLNDLSLQYSDYALWQRKYLDGDILETQLSYWENQLQDVPPLMFPTDYTRPSIQSTAGSELSITLDKKLRDALNALAKEEGVTLFMVLLTAFKIVLYRYSGQKDICVGTSIANRTQAELEGIIGFFVNSLAIRTDLDDNPTFSDLLNQVKTTTLEAYEHQSVPFEKVVDRVLNTRDMSKSPLFQVMFELQNVPISEELELDGLRLSPYETKTNTAKFDFTVTSFDTGTNLLIDIEYCTALFREETIQRMMNHYKEILKGIVENSNTKIDTLSMLSKEEKRQLLYGFNDTITDYPLDKTVVDIFKDKVKEIPDAIAVIHEEEILTYRALDERSNQLAHYLRSQGVGKDILVGICLERSLDMIIGILAVFKAGGAYVPMKPDYPESRINYILNEIRSTIVLTDIVSAAVIPLAESRNIFALDANKDMLSEYPITPLSISISPSSLSYVIYTSGSTGKPKGAMIEHKGMLNHLYAKIEGLDMNAESVVAFTAPFTFDISVWQIFSTLIIGGKIIVYKEEYVQDPLLLLNSIEKEDVNILQIVPSYVSSLLEIDSNDVLNQLKYFIVTGEAVSASLLTAWFEKYPTIPVANAYGPTEASDDVSTHFMYEAPDVLNVSIGKPMSNMQLYVVDQSNNLCPIGVQGELWVSGVGVGRGYLNDEEKTDKSFITNPFINTERVYKTGDLAKWLPDGSLEYLGRIDDQVKVRGHRIELGEIENVLSKEPTIKSCCILAKKDSREINNLVGYVVVNGDFDKQNIQNHLKSRLPDYMVPRVWVELETMPLTPNGKINRKMLPDLEGAELSMQEFVAPRNNIEKQLVLVWQNVLNIGQIGVFDNFFELGGHSLLATRVVSALRKTAHIEMAIKDVFMYPTIAELGEYITTTSRDAILPSITVQERVDKTPLSFSQERLWFVDQLEGSIAYHIPIIVNLEGDVDVSFVETSLKTILMRHESLRTVIKSEGGIAYQEVLSPDDWRMNKVSISDPSELENIVTNYTSRPFDLSSDYMFRTCLCKLREGKYVLSAVFHHISSDGWSDGIFISEFVELYKSQKERREPLLVNLPLQYRDYAIWQRKYVEGEILKTQLSYWKNQLTGVSTLTLPTDYTRPLIQSTSGAILSFELDKELRDVLVNMCKEEGVTLFMFLLTAFKVLLHKYSGQEDICVGTPIANRTQSELENLIGFFVNTLAIRSNLGENPIFLDLLKEVKSTTLEAYEHQLVPFEKMVDHVVDMRDMRTSPLFQVLFVLQNTPEEENLGLEGITLSTYEHKHTTSKFDMTMTAEDIKSGISLDVEYCTDLFTQETISRMLIHFEELLKNIVSKPNECIGDIPILTDKEKAQLLDTFNLTQTDYNIKRTVIDLFSEQVNKTPDYTAIVFKGEEITYKELDKLSNQFAHYLLSKYTLNQEDLIGVKLDRSEWLIISILAVLKTGCAYVPIDPNYPEERISYIKEDSNSKLIIDKAILNQYQENKENYTSKIPDINIQADHLAYVIYTSGSTGKPKGVLIEHRNLINLCLWHQQAYKVTDQSKGVLFSGVGFDASVWEIYPYLLGGGTLYPIHEDETRYDITWLTDFIVKHKVSHIYLPSQICHDMVDQEVLLDGVTILTGGDTLKLSKETSLQIYNNYGPTENTVVSTFYKLSGNHVNMIPIGKPISNTSVYILGSNEELLPIGVTGELCVSGSGLARGYLNQKELTKEKFIKNPFIKGERMYKTGDLARWLPNGTIEFIGRKDDQVKIRGYRIELGEIESVLEEIPEVTQSVVLAKEDTQGNKRLVGYVVREDNTDKEELKNYLHTKLPEYMVPRLWVVIEAIPLTNNGKIDKKALPDPDMSDLVKDYVAPQTEIEKQLSEIWQNVLGVKKVGIHDNFFELGGDSIITIQVVSRAKHFGIVMQPRDLFKHQTISELSEAIQNGASLVIGEQGILTGESDLLPIQRWYFDTSYSTLKNAQYNQTLLLSIDKSMAISSIEEMVQTIVNHHDALRFLYHKEEGGWKQVYKNDPNQLIIEDLSSIPVDNVSESITTVCEFYQRSLSIEKGEIFKIILIKTAKTEHKNRLFIVAHHLVVDGVSWRILIQDLTLILKSLQDNSVFDLGSKSSSFRQWVHCLKEYATNKAFFTQQSYWSTIINSYKSLPVDYKDRDQQNRSSVRECHMVLEKELTTSLLQETHKAYGTEINDILLSCLALTIGNWSGFEKVVIGLEGHGREDISKTIDLSNTVGWFTNLYPISLSVSPEFSLADIIKSVKEELRSIPDKGIGYGALKYLHPELSIRESLSGTHWDIIFNYLGQFDNVIENESVINIAEESSGKDVGDQVVFCNKLEINGSVNDGVLVLTWNYSENQYDPSTIKKLSDSYLSNLKMLILHCISKEGRDFTPSDYGLGKEVGYQELDTFLNEDLDSEELLKI